MIEPSRERPLLLALMKHFGPRMRQQSSFALRTATAAVDEGVGCVIVIHVPPSSSTPIEVKTYPWGTTVHAHGETKHHK